MTINEQILEQIKSGEIAIRPKLFSTGSREPGAKAGTGNSPRNHPAALTRSRCTHRWHKISIQNQHSSFSEGAIYALRELAQAYPKE